MAITETIYIRLLDEGVDTWRPTHGERIRGNVFKVLPTDDYDPEDEEWEFVPGSIVQCELQKKTSRGEPKEILVAISAD